MALRETPEINAGSMADIAFLLLIFFLVTTTMDSDMGILKRLPKKNQEGIIADAIKKNVLEIHINSNNEIMLNNSELSINEVKQQIISFIDNGAGTDLDGNPCTWCNGAKDIKSSDHPTKAIIQLQSNRNTSYATYIAVQNEIMAAYNELRNQLSLSLYEKPFELLLTNHKNNKGDKDIYSKIKAVKSKYPQLIFEKDPVGM